MGNRDDKRPVHIAIVGCGIIANAYAETLKPSPHLRLVGATDLDLSRAQKYVDAHGGRVYSSLDEILADGQVDVVVNLTIQQAHYSVCKQAILAGKHVFSEKPLALIPEEAHELVALAEEKGVRLGCAPVTVLGEAQQTAWKWIREQKLGAVRVVYAEVNWGRIETWHPAPQPFYAVGPLFDVGVYPLTILTTIFGPARRLIAAGKVLLPDRVTRDGTPFRVETPDFVTAIIELASGTVVRLTTSFYVGQHSKQRGLEFHGDHGSLYLDDWVNCDGGLWYADSGKEYQPVAPVKEPYRGMEWSRGLVEMAEAIAEGRSQRITGVQAAHIVDILSAVKTSYTEGRPVTISSEFPQPAPMDWAK
ncbi:MAG: Gfo/Idh/MocA family oxidoreductase [Ktedonobacteraceae bacterium]|nr:Gfo/Idh/MocA family oxidoreductase [Ktedonobacteraceae bacterium]